MTAARNDDVIADSFEPLGLGWRAVLMAGAVTISVRRLRRDAGSLRGLRIACWCRPAACHGDVLASLLNDGLLA